jgi:site-specific DNA-methyltransferase (adenine-specific)
VSVEKVQIGDCTLYRGDCLDVLPTLSASGILTDPPYGMNYRSRHNDGRKGKGLEMVRKDGNFSPIRGDSEPFSPSHLLALDLPTIIWGGNYFCNALPGGTRWLVWDKLAGKTPFPSGSDVEMAWTSMAGPLRMFTHLWRGIMRAGEENVVHGGKQHPNQKPAALMRWCLGQMPDDCDLICDPYMGSGTTGVACVQMGRPFIGVELDPEHFKTACRRIERAYADQPLLEMTA